MSACKNCSAKPKSVHRNEDGLASSIRFSTKVILTDEFLNHLFIPPRFAREIASLTNKEVQIKDTSGRSWTVKLSYINGVLAFSRGWRTFTLEHGIKPNDQVLISYISASEFLCEIFGMTSSKKWQFPSSSNTRASNGSTYEDSCHVPVTEINKEESCFAHGNGLKRKFVEDPCCILNRDIDYEQNVDRRRCFLDLSEFEIYKSVLDRDNSSSSVQDGESEHADMEEQIHESSFVENSINLLAFEADMRIPCDGAVQIADLYAQTAAFQGTPMEAQGADFEAQTTAFQGQTANVTGTAVEAETADFNGETTAFQGQTANFTGPAMEAQTADSNDVVKGPEVSKPKNEQKRFNPQPFVESAKIAKEERNEFNPQGLGGSVRNVKIESKNFSPNALGGRTRIVKEEPNLNLNSSGSIRTAGLVKKEPTEFESRHIGASSSYQVLKKVKTEGQDFTPPQSEVTCSVPITSDDNYLMLPRQFSSFGCMTNKNVERKMEHIRDSAGRLWPVIWCRKSGQNALTAGWKSLRDANGIQIGDECVFSHEDDNQGIIKVNVI